MARSVRYRYPRVRKPFSGICPFRARGRDVISYSPYVARWIVGPLFGAQRHIRHVRPGYGWHTSIFQDLTAETMSAPFPLTGPGTWAGAGQWGRWRVVAGNLL